MHARDLAQIIRLCIEREVIENMNVATEENLSIAEITRIALEACGAQHLKVDWDTTKPNGQMRKDVSIARLRRVFPDFRFLPLRDGIRGVYEYVRERDL